MARRMASHYLTLRLLDAEGNWGSRWLTHHPPLMNWSDPALIRFWGKYARESASRYALLGKASFK